MGNRFFLAIAVDCHRNTEFPLLYVTKMSGKAGGRYRICLLYTSGVTDREYYTNSFHIPVYYEINAFDKIRLEAPYHALTNGGHIT